MKKTFAVGAAAIALLVALTGCSGTRDTRGTMTADQSYTANSAGRTNEAGDNGVMTGSNSTATNGTNKKRTTTKDDTAADRMERDRRTESATGSGTVTAPQTTTGDGSVVGTVQDGSSAAARDVRRAVNRAGDVVDDVAYGAADIVNGATDVVTGNDSRQVTTTDSNGRQVTTVR